MNSHNSQLIKIFQFARNLANCELLTCSDLGMDGVIMERLSWGCLSDLPQCGRGYFISCDRCRPSLWFSHGFFSRTPCYLAVSFLFPLIAGQPPPLCLDFALQFCRPTACLLTCLGRYGAAPSCVSIVSSHLCWAVVSAHVMPRDGRFVQAPSSCASAPIYMLGFGRVLPLADSLLAD